MWPSIIHRSVVRCARVASLFMMTSVSVLHADGPTFILQPVPPKTVPASDYPPGSSIVGQEIILGSVPARVWLEVQVTGFPTDDYPNCARSVQAVIDAFDYYFDGGGYYGANADCLGSPANGGNLTNATQTCSKRCSLNTALSCGFNADCPPGSGSCTSDLECRQTMSGRTSTCPTGEPVSCTGGGSYGYCWPLFIDTCDAEWICAGIGCIPGVDGDPPPRAGAAVNADPGICMKDFSPSYVFTLVLDVPANAKGSYTLDFSEPETFLLNDNPAPNNNIPISLYLPAKITIPCGSCCSGYSTTTLECVDHVVESDCVGSADQVFTADQLCPDNGGACPQCASDADCDDGIACTVDQCQSDHSCQRSPSQASCDDGLFCNGPEICDPSSGCIAGPIPCDFRLCDEDADLCRAGIPTVSNWGLLILAIGLLTAAKLRSRLLHGVTLRSRRTSHVITLTLALASSVAYAGGPTMILQPVAPKTVPASNYPPGSSIVGQELILGSVPARVWLEIQITGWAPEVIRAVQARISATDPEGDGGGYFGTSAMCQGAPSIGAGDLRPALQPCTTNADCRATMSGLTGPCFAGEPCSCRSWNGVSPDFMLAGNYCDPWFQDLCDPQWAAGISAVQNHVLDFRGGFVMNAPDVATDFSPSYVLTLILDVPATAKGTYTIDFDESQSFMLNYNYAPNNVVPISSFLPAKITIACGRCCSGYGSDQVDCVDHVTEVDCANAGSQIFTEDALCPANGGPQCAECSTNGDCDDGLFCNGPEICDSSSGCIAGAIPCDIRLCEEEADLCRAGTPSPCLSPPNCVSHRTKQFDFFFVLFGPSWWNNAS